MAAILLLVAAFALTRVVDNRYVYFAGYVDPAVHRPRHRVEHPRRLHRLRELRHRRLLRPRRVHLGVSRSRRPARRSPCRSRRAALVAGLLGLGIGYLTLRLRGVVLLDRHARARRRARDDDRSTGSTSGGAKRHQHHPAGRRAVLRQLHLVPVHGDERARPRRRWPSPGSSSTRRSAGASRPSATTRRRPSARACPRSG